MESDKAQIRQPIATGMDATQAGNENTTCVTVGATDRPVKQSSSEPAHRLGRAALDPIGSRKVRRSIRHVQGVRMA